MSDHLWNARGCTNEAMAILGDAIQAYEDELRMRDGHDTGVHGGEIQESIRTLRYVCSRLRRLHRESRVLNGDIRDWQADQDRLSDLEDARSY